MKFEDLRFENKCHNRGVQAVTFFPNGYGASVIKGPHSYGGPSGLYELAVLKGSEGKSSLCYDTPITNDVMGYLSPPDVTALLHKIEALPNAG